MLSLRLRSIVPVLAAAALALLAALALAAPGAAAPTAAKACRTKAPVSVAFKRDRGRSYGWLRWTRPKRARGAVRYRVTVNGAHRRPTTARRLKVRARPGQRMRFTVATTRAPRCARALRTTATFYAPTTPTKVTAATLSDAAVRLSWRKSRNGDGKLAGYRVARNGVVYRQVSGTTLDVAVPVGVQSTLTVASVDTQGHVSAASAPVTVGAAHRTPGAPVGVSAIAVSSSAIGLSWSAGAPGMGRTVGYRVYRDGALVAQVAGGSAVVGNLAAGRA
jgi:hypothetical protein